MNDDDGWLKLRTSGDWRFAGWLVAGMVLVFAAMWLFTNQ